MNTDLTLRDLVARAMPPRPWVEGDNIPWNDPAFSERMLREHLSQEHDLASRRLDIIDAQVEWIHRDVLGEVPSRILDLGCGPGLYSHRLARLGHRCIGLDFGPASIAHAQQEAAGLHCEFLLADLRHAALPSHRDLVLFNYGQLNVFPREEAAGLVRRAHGALRDGGQLLLEVQTEAQVRSADGAPPTWFAADGGLFAEGPHLVLHEHFWNEELRSATERWHVIDQSGSVTRFALSNEAYSHDELQAMLREAGFARVENLDRFGGSPDDSPMFGVRAVR
jgi:SAM-dependent methyltransferase